VPDPRLRVLMSMRADFFGELQKDEALYAVHRQINVPPLREAQLREVVSKPPDMLSARFETPQIVDMITSRTAEDSVRDVGALPLLSYTLDDMWGQMIERGDATLRLPAQSFDLSGVLVDRANAFLATHPGAEAALRRVLTLRLATVREDGEPTRRRAFRHEFSDEEWRLVSELADHPNRLLVTATTEAEDIYAEVAHEAIFRRWDKLKEWIAAEREFLAWRSSLETDFRRWRQTPLDTKDEALLMGAALAQASDRLLRLGVVDRSLSSELIEFIRLSEDRAKKELTERASLERARDEAERLKREKAAREELAVQRSYLRARAAFSAVVLAFSIRIYVVLIYLFLIPGARNAVTEFGWGHVPPEKLGGFIFLSNAMEPIEIGCGLVSLIATMILFYFAARSLRREVMQHFSPAITALGLLIPF
jgi:hypothetical protein